MITQTFCRQGFMRQPNQFMGAVMRAKHVGAGIRTTREGAPMAQKVCDMVFVSAGTPG